jgi:hypothetical protein
MGIYPCLVVFIAKTMGCLRMTYIKNHLSQEDKTFLQLQFIKNSTRPILGNRRLIIILPN